ncbi:hypothetical protein ATANTOWER_011421 [Ataeniobius toweri]|uniref:Uncharacterized protein n=1 Tax=Ataeniobius toweri TaxID=208326 RepID=A0ABU7C6Z8_9TELE|nr:hypothetical protein [Ataeniobius toweri]
MCAALASIHTAVLAGRRCLEGTSVLFQFAGIHVATGSVPDPTCAPVPTASSLPAVEVEEVSSTTKQITLKVQPPQAIKHRDGLLFCANMSLLHS